LMIVAMPQMAAAQPLPLYLLNPDPEALVAAAFSSPYGQALVDETAAVIGESAEAACVQAKGMQKSAIAERARTILVQHGAAAIRILATAIDRSKYEAGLVARKGPDAVAELERLRRDPLIQEFRAIQRPLADANLANWVVEQFDRYVLIKRVKLVRGVSPINTGKEQLLQADPTDQTLEKLDAFADSNKSATLERYLDYTQAAIGSLGEAANREQLQKTGPIEWMAGLDDELAALCVPH
jgi:hypothetical protein